ncbi:pancreatic lipase-related protein 2-like [Anolis sagrei]|uniref:pancreatic lipase-related protein 2-like n=1 Tax=Anolis sagrei TaxID=38937 RepID=UPI00351FA632
MFGVWFTAFLLHVIVRGSEICFNRLGCFENGPPWGGTLQRPMLNFPEPPEIVNTAFHLYTRENPIYFQVISAVNPSTIKVSNFRTNRKTRFIIHGYFVGDEYDRIVNICRFFLQKEDINCIVVNWKAAAADLYTQSVQNVRIVGAEMAYLLDYLEENCGYSLSDVHIIGHSLGAHAGGEAGRRKPGLSRITGLDPAGPLFHQTPPEVRLDPSDAKFVDVIHTNIGHLFFEFASGIIQPCGHLDFYPNGGGIMPGCKKDLFVSKQGDIDGAMREIASSRSAGCSHKRSLRYYSDSIFIPDGFLGYQCKTFDSFASGKCFPCPREGCPMMGHYADQFADKTKAIHQVFYLTTKAVPPFACWRKRVSVKLFGTQIERGNITVALIGANEIRKEYLIFTGFLYPRYAYTRVVDVPISGEIVAVEFQWKTHAAWQRISHIGARDISIVYGKNGNSSVFCGSTTVYPEVWQKLSPCEAHMKR